MSKIQLTLIERDYLNLLQKVLTNTLFGVEPDIEQIKGATFMRTIAEHYIDSNAVSLLPKVRFKNIEDLVFQVVDDKIDGDLIETGVWRGGAVIYMRALLKTLNITNRNVWVADSFEGLPTPDKEKNPLEAETSEVIKLMYQNFEAGLEEVKNNFQRFDLLDEQVKWLKGWFKDILPSAPIERLALIRLDGDYYDSTIDSLANLYDKLSVGGFVIVDDYGEDTWTDCRRAIHDFRSSKNIMDPIVPVDSVCVYWRKT